METVKSSIQYNGIRGPFQGLSATLLRNIPANAVFWILRVLQGNGVQAVQLQDERPLCGSPVFHGWPRRVPLLGAPLPGRRHQIQNAGGRRLEERQKVQEHLAERGQPLQGRRREGLLQGILALHAQVDTGEWHHVDDCR